MKNGSIPQSPIVAVTGDDVEELGSLGMFEGVGNGPVV
jgi:hypothetical protein